MTTRHIFAFPRRDFASGSCALRQVAKNGATRIVTNGQPGGSNRTGDVQPYDGIVVFNP
jgi:hypothetical protein